MKKKMQQLSCADNIKSCFIQMQYLKQRTLNFSEVKKHLFMDEGYVTNHVEYQNGTFFLISQNMVHVQEQF